MKAERLFLAKLGELHTRATPELDEYDLLAVSGLLRHLLLDRLLIDAVRDTQVAIRFEMVVPPDLDTSNDDGLIAAVDSARMLAVTDAPAHWERRQMKLDQFLAVPLIRTAVDTFTTADVINVCANRLGGIHHQGNKRPRLNELANLNEYELLGMPMPVREIAGIADRTLAACEPLRSLLSARSY